MNEIGLRSLVWTDYRLAILITLIIPLVLLIWSLFKRNEAINRLLIIYWRVASLLIITLYLMIPGWGIGYLTFVAARIFIPISLWFWADINEEIKDMPQKKLKLALTSWRWAIALYCIVGVVGAIVSANWIDCAFSNGLFAMPSNSSCQAWLEAPRAYKNFFHPKANNEGFLGFLGMIGLIVYALYLFYFVLIRLGRQGRSALEQ